jgi:hypothetical protein
MERGVSGPAEGHIHMVTSQVHSVFTVHVTTAKTAW